MIPCLLLLLLANTARAADPPYFLRDSGGRRDVGGINENVRSLSDSARATQNDLDALEAAYKTDLLDDDNTWTGTNTFNSSTTFNGGVFGTINASTEGVIAVSYTLGSTAGVCITGSTLTMTTQAVNAEMSFTGTTSNTSASGVTNFNVLQDGAYISPWSSSAPILQVRDTGGATALETSASFRIRTRTALSAASHSWCIVAYVGSGGGSMCPSTLPCQVEIRELR